MTLLDGAVIEAMDTLAVVLVVTATAVTVAFASPAPDAVSAAFAVAVVGAGTLAPITAGLRVHVAHAPGGGDDTMAATAEANRDVVDRTSTRFSRSSAAAPVGPSGPPSSGSAPRCLGRDLASLRRPSAVALVGRTHLHDTQQGDPLKNAIAISLSERTVV